jgi:hypothetical protein
MAVSLSPIPPKPPFTYSIWFQSFSTTLIHRFALISSICRPNASVVAALWKVEGSGTSRMRSVYFRCQRTSRTEAYFGEDDLYIPPNSYSYFFNSTLRYVPSQDMAVNCFWPLWLPQLHQIRFRVSSVHHMSLRWKGFWFRSFESGLGL